MVKKQASGSELQLLKTHIREKNPERLYIFFGEETFLLEHYLGSLKKLVLDALTESFNYHRFNTETFDLTAFSEAVENLPMMAERTLVQVEDIDLFKMNEADRDRIAAVLSDIPEYCVVVFVYTACPWKPDKRMKKLWESIDKNGLVVEFAKQDQRDLIAWLTRHFSAHQKRISTELCAYLIDITDGTMTSLLGEIEKICAYSAADTICKADIDAVTEPVLDAVVFQMTDLLSAGRYDEALLKLQQLLKMQQELQEKEYQAAAGGGVVTATVNGKHELKNLEIDPEAVDPDDVEMLQDLIVAAVNEAMRSADNDASSSMQKLTGGLGLPF